MTRQDVDLQLGILGLEPLDAAADEQSGFSHPVWTWPQEPAGGGESPDHPLARCLDGRFEPGPSAGEAENEVVCDDPDALAVAALATVSDATPPPVNALSRALGDWRLAGGTRDGFAVQVADWRRQGFARLLCLDPVHLKPETDHAITFGPRFLALSEEELVGLLEGINPWLAQDGMQAVRIGRQTYLLAESRVDGVGPASAAFHRAGAPLACLLNRNAGVFIDEERSDPVLRQWLTELQMWLYPQPLNDARAARGQPIISSFWPHGLSALDNALPDPASLPARVLSDSPAVLASTDAGIWQPDAVGEAVEAIAAGRPVRVLLTEPAWCRLEGDLGGFQQELARIDDWLARLQEQRPDVSVRLDDGRGGRWLPESGLGRLWRQLRRRLS